MLKRYSIALLLVLGVILAVGALTAQAVPPQPHYIPPAGAVTVDGNIGEWDTTTAGPDFFAYMYRAGKDDKPVESHLFLRYDCETERLYALVLSVNGQNIRAGSSNDNDHFININGGGTEVDADNSPPNGNLPDFAWYDRQNLGTQQDPVWRARGWEAVIELEPGSYDLNVHTQVQSDGESQTSAVDDREIDLVIECPQLSFFTVIKYYDADLDGEYDEGETLLPGWSFHVYDENGDEVLGSPFVTDGDGEVQITLPVGTYTVCEELPAGWGNSDPGTIDGTYGAPCEEVTLPAHGPETTTMTAGGANFRVTLVSHVGNTWTYRVERISGMGSNRIRGWGLGIEACFGHITSSDAIDTSSTQTGTQGTWTDPNPDFVGLFWDRGSSSDFGSDERFSFTLDDDYPATTVSTIVRNSNGGGFGTNSIIGPDCDPEVLYFGNYDLPSVELDKSANPGSLPEPGGEFTFTLSITNTSPYPVEITALTDDYTLSAECLALIGEVLDPNETVQCEYTVTLTDVGQYDNTAEVTVENSRGDEASDDDDATVYVTDVLPSVDLVKDVDVQDLDEPGGTFTFTLTIYNNSVEEVTITSLTDDNSADSPDWAANCGILIGTTIPAGGNVSCTYTVDHTEPGSYDNTAVVVVVDDEQNEASDSDSETVRVRDVLPEVELDKSADPSSLPEPGGTFTFTLTIYNNSVEEVTITALTDDYALSAECLALIGTTIPAGGSVSCTYEVELTDAGEYLNEASVTVVDDEQNEASDTDDETVHVTDETPTVDLIKSVDDDSKPEPGGSFYFTLTITNLSSEPVEITALTDTNSSAAQGWSNCENLIGTVLAPAGEPGDSVDCTYDVNHGYVGVYDNTAEVTVQDNEENEASDSDTESVEVTDVLPSVDLVKDVDTNNLPYPGGTFTFTLTIYNTSVEPVEITALTDDNSGDSPDWAANCAGLIGTVLAPSGNPNDSVSCTYTVDHTDPGSYPNTAEVTVVDDEQNEASDSDSETVSVGEIPTATLTVIKRIEWGDVTPDPNLEFQICVYTHPEGEQVDCWNYGDDEERELVLPLGDYYVNETPDPDPNDWGVSGEGVYTLGPNGVTAEITNRRVQPPQGCRQRTTAAITQANRSYLSGQIIIDGGNAYGTISLSPNAPECLNWPVGLAVYLKFNTSLSQQIIHGSDTDTLPLDPGQTIVYALGPVSLPGCRVQVDLFFGDLISPMLNQFYGWRLLQALHTTGGGWVYCTNTDFDGDGLTDFDEINDGNAGTDPLVFNDADGDGLGDGFEISIGTNPNNPDTDGDGWSDGHEFFNTGTNPAAFDDPDGDGVGSGTEESQGTNPNNPDTDGDGLNDGVDPAPLAFNDTDGDGLGDGTEVTLGTDLNNPDTDGDGLSDSVEVGLGTNPLLADTDGDGFSDGDEVNVHGTDPLDNTSHP